MSGHTRWVTSALRSEALAPLRDDRAHGATLFDLDGTLAPIAGQPSEARVPEPTRKLLIEVARRYPIVACVTGRRASEARAMVAIGTITYLGSHGAEMLRAGWTEATLDPALAEWAMRIHEFGHERDTSELRRRRVRIEDKGAIVAFHWRGAPDEQSARAAVDAIAADAQDAGLRTHWGRKVLEIRPPVEFDKGAAIASFLRDTDVDVALYAGDDVTDLDAFRSLTELVEEGRLAHAIRVGVSSDEGPREITAEADIVVEGTEGVTELLALLVADQD
jgi:trehalose 6-phosphate phosphatase